MRSIIPLGISLALSILAVQAAETIQYSVPDGLTYRFDQRNELDATLDLEAGGQRMQVAQQLTQVLQGTATVLETANGKPTRLRVRFAPDCGTVTHMNGAAQPIPFPLAGLEAEIRVQGEEVVSVEPVGGSPVALDDATRDMVSAAVVLQDAMLPGRPVGAGDQWLADFTEPDGSVRPRLNLTVQRFAEAAGRKVAALDAQGTLSGKQDAMTMNGTLSGTVNLDVATGMPASMDLSGDVAITGEVAEGGYTVRMQGDGRMTMRSRITIGSVDSMAAMKPLRRTAPPRQDVPRRNGAAATASTDDRRLIGMFGGEAIAGGEYGAYVNTQLVYVINGDGTLFYGAQSHFSASDRDYNGDLRWTATGQTGQSVDRGRWSARDGILTVQWENGNRMVVAYGFEPDGSLVLRNAQTRKLINFYRRIH